MTKEFVQWPEFIIDDIDTLKVLTDARRIRILELMVLRPYTTKELALKLDMQPSKLYYHINLLEKHGLIQVVDTRIVSGIVEKHYQAVAKSYNPSRDLFNSYPDDADLDKQFQSLALATLDKTREDLLNSFAQGLIDMRPDGEEGMNVMAINGILFQTPEQNELFWADLQELLEKYGQGTAAESSLNPENVRAYNFSLMMFPIIAEKEEPDKDNKE